MTYHQDVRPIITEEESVAAVPRFAPRARPGPIPAADIDAAPLACVAINRLWVPHVLGVLDALDQPDAWQGTEEEIFNARQQVIALMLGLMNPCSPIGCNQIGAILDLEPIAFWPMNVTSGTFVPDQTGNGCTGTATGVTWGHTGPDGKPAALFDGVNDTIDIKTNQLRDLFNGQEGGFLVWIEPGDSSFWSDGVDHWITNIEFYDDHVLSVGKTAAGKVSASRVTGSGSKTVLSDVLTGLDWLQVAVTWSVSNDALKLFLDGVEVDSESGLGTFIDVNLYRAYLGTINGSSYPLHGGMAYAALFDYALSQEQLESVAI